MAAVAVSPAALPRFLHTAAIPAAAFLVFAVCVLAGWGSRSAVSETVNTVGALAFPLFAAVSAGVAARRTRGQQRRAWLYMTLGLAAWTVGDIVVLYSRFWLGRTHPLVPAAASAAFLLFPVAACGAMVAFPAGYPDGVRFRMVLDGAIVAASLFVVSWVAVLRQAYAATGVKNPAAFGSLAYPALEVIAVTVAVLVLTRAHPRWRLTVMLLTGGLALIAASGGGYAYMFARNTYAFESPVGLGWSAGLVMVGIAALACPAEPPHAPQEPSATLIAPTSLWLPCIPLAIAGGLELIEFRNSLKSDPAFDVVPWLIIAMLARQFLVVAENRRLLHTVSARALRDPLTNLANRVLFHDRLEQAVQLNHRDQRSVAVLSMDLDDFKLINDNLGHAAGDALLVQAAQRLLGCVRTGDTVARLGGDEFAVLIEDAGEHAHLIVYQIMEAFERPFSTDGESIFMRPSAGLAVAGADDSDLRASDLLKHADMAMYSAKRLGGGLQTFCPDMHGSDDTGPTFAVSDVQPSSRGLGEVRLLSDLRQAIGHRALTVLYQPKINLQTSAVVGAEALVRWPHPVFGLVQPQQFLPLVRQHGLMRTFTDVVLDQALSDAAQWRRRGCDVPVAVNLFPPLVGDVALPRRIFDALARHDLPGEALIVEITEDLLLDNIDRTRDVLEVLRERHVHIALDDFGSGYSALTYLRKLPIDEVKVDYDLIGNVLTDPRAQAIVRAVIDLAHALHVTTVAEVVENAETAEWLQDLGCEVAQGIYYSPPIAAPAMMDLIGVAGSVVS
ncbi:MAG: bifunctional diguanylate cyclase/phosphodiesterase [Mycobacterium sp.]